ncbi:Rrf2 family transcriptional regulator [Paenibacillus sp. 1011MAR3C5]|uniref:RrF2 family transcriptional regulator n=1 Tax=Paenibacillus sp. 1011MAR3C5 TaxID=1675787 RepID=UPI000E6C63CC|nr:Rrf2 family transcriptional regulator [Paenibacillus sp. 1011MAR3C5]RJE86921.1 Rrf2 family transcriptional regulator [Paenibacillus sp. 1011MAR3C5]
MSITNRGIHIGPPRFKIAVHAVIWLAKSGGVLSSARIACLVKSHATFMRRVLQSLAAAGIVESKGGREGGYVLLKCPNQITLGDIYYAVNQEAAETELEMQCGDAGEQLDIELEKILFETEQHTINYLRKYTIEDVAKRIDHCTL